MEDAGETLKKGKEYSRKWVTVLCISCEFGKNFINLSCQIEGYTVAEKGREVFWLDETFAPASVRRFYTLAARRVFECE